MNSALLSRFDLVFILLDKPDEQMDRFLSDHIMKMHAGGGKKDTGFRNAWGIFSSSIRLNLAATVNKNTREENEGDLALEDRLKIGQVENFEPFPQPLLRKYVAYARKYVHPKYVKRN
jgi:DNA helicase MCM8